MSSSEFRAEMTKTAFEISRAYRLELDQEQTLLRDYFKSFLFMSSVLESY
jgi:hypothetical protein